MPAKPAAAKRAAARSRWKRLLLPAAVLLPVMGVVALVVYATRTEVLTPKEILAKKNWTEQELKTSLAYSFQIRNTGRERNDEVMRHLRVQLDKLPAEKRRQIQAEAMVEALSGSLEQFRILQGEERRQLIERVDQQANRTLGKAVTGTPAEQRAVREKMASDEGKMVLNEVNRIMVGKMTAEERSEVGPIVQKWLRIMQGA